MNVYITTPIFYVNAHPHIGHAYTTVVADTFARFKRLSGDDVFFQTGTDEHGDKIAQAARDAGVSPREYVDSISAVFRATWPLLDVTPDNFIRTTDENHKATVQKILQEVFDKGDIYFSEYSGLYCKGCEQFVTEKELVDGKCPDHLTVPEAVNEQNYFFRMSRYQDWLIDHIEQNPDFITPERYKNEVLSFLKEPLTDLCISRPKSRLTWGIELPFDDRFVTYVWFDALINYLTGIGYPDSPDFSRWWSGAEHIIAKDILKPHAIYWPTMLKAMGLAPYRRLHVHGYWNMGEAKMSKSLGNVVTPSELVETYGADTVRYVLLREMSFGLDASFSLTMMEERYNSELANDLGNLFSRSLTMVKNFCAGKVPAPGPLEDQDLEIKDAALAMVETFQERVESFGFRQALEAAWEVIGRANRYIVNNAPWELAKDDGKKERLGTVLHTLLETLRIIGTVLAPVMPQASRKMLDSLGVKQAAMSEAARWDRLEPGSGITLGEPLFPRLPSKKNKKQPPKVKEPPPRDTEGLISFDAFQQLDLRVAEIVAAERIPKADRLLKLTVKIPEERCIVAGIAEHYQPHELVGRRVIVVANLKPAKLRGVVSQGMVLAAKHGDRLTLATVDDTVPPGTKVS